MSDYPAAIDTFREIENLPGLVYDEDDKRTFFTEDLQAVRDSITNIENTLGLEPQASYDDVVERLGAIDTAISGKQNSLGFTPEDVANKSTSTSLGTSDTLYPTQKAVKTYVDNNSGAVGIDLIDSGSFPAASTLVIDDIPQIYRRLVITFLGVSSNTGTRRPLIQVSTNNGSSWRTSGYYTLADADFVFSSDRLSGPVNTVAASATWDGFIVINGYQREGALTCKGIWLGSAGNYLEDNSMIIGGSSNHVDAIRFLLNNSGNFDNGTYELFGYK